MANQSPDRRKVLDMLAKMAVLSQSPGFVNWVSAAHSGPKKPHTPGTVYQPRFFKPNDYATVDRLTDLIIPADETPGAHDAGVAEFIDFMVASDKDLQPKFSAGLNQFHAMAVERFGTAFGHLSEPHQIQFLQGAVSTEFFRLIREYTVMGYYTSRIGLEQLQYPGLKMYSQSPSCPHKSDPEHAHLAEVKA